MSLFKKNQSQTDRLEALLDTPLYKVPGTDTVITWRDIVEGTLITGATGSGKSSGPGMYAAKAKLKAGFGACILCGKVDEKRRWVRYAKETGREDDLIIFNKESDLQFDFLQYEMERKGEGAGDVLNANQALMNLNEQNRVYLSGGGGEGEDQFWDKAVRRNISNNMSLLRYADEPVTIENMRNIIANCFTARQAEAYDDLERQINSKRKIDEKKRLKALEDLAWLSESNYIVWLVKKIHSKTISSPAEKRKVRFVCDYWLKDFPRMSDKTTGTVLESFMGIADPFMNEGILNSQFSGGLSEELLPENIIKNKKIVIIDFPIKEFGVSGIFASTIYKTAFQEAMERRNVEEESDPKPVVLWVDEYQLFCNPTKDTQFQTTARSSWVSTVYLTQSVNNIFFVMGNHQPEARAKGLLGNLNLKYFCNNADIETNYWASQMIGQHLSDLESLNISNKMELSKSKRQQMMYKVMPDFFTMLKNGAKPNNYMVQAVAFKSGKLWGKEKKNFAMVEFDQRA